MSAPFIVPFNFAPVSTAKGTTGSYTVPAGKYALVNISIDHAFYHSTSFTVSFAGLSSALVSLGNRSESFSLWLKAGDVLTLANTNTNASATISRNGFGAVDLNVSLQASSVTSITIGGSLWKNSTSRGSLTGFSSYTTGGGGDTTTFSVTCESSLGWYAQEYNQIT